MDWPSEGGRPVEVAHANAKMDHDSMRAYWRGCRLNDSPIAALAENLNFYTPRLSFLSS